MNQVPPVPANRPRVMVVDDDPGVLAMAQAVLESAGFEVVLASSGEIALSIYVRDYFAGLGVDIVLMDVTLPGGMSGIEALDALKRVNPLVKVFASSGYFDESAAPVAKRRGFLGILPKPYGAERLTKLVGWGVGRVA